MAHSVDLLAGVDIKKPLHSGILYKQAHNHLYSVFNKRFFVLYPKILLYYVHERDFRSDVDRGHLDHRDKGLILEGVYLTKPEKKPPGAKYCFVLHCPHKQNKRKEMILVGETRESRRIWMDVLQQQNPALLEDEHHHHHHHHHHGHHHQGNQGMQTLEVPRGRVRADSISVSGDEEEQNLNVAEHSDYEHSDHEDS